MRSLLLSPESWSRKSSKVSPATFPKSSAISPCGKCSNLADLKPIVKLPPSSAWVELRASPCPPSTPSSRPSPSSIALLSSLSTKTSLVSLVLQTFRCIPFPDIFTARSPTLLGHLVEAQYIVPTPRRALCVLTLPVGGVSALSVLPCCRRTRCQATSTGLARSFESWTRLRRRGRG